MPFTAVNGMRVVFDSIERLPAVTHQVLLNASPFSTNLAEYPLPSTERLPDHELAANTSRVAG